jgi:hypothetical protein
MRGRWLAQALPPGRLRRESGRKRLGSGGGRTPARQGHGPVFEARQSTRTLQTANLGLGLNLCAALFLDTMGTLGPIIVG